MARLTNQEAFDIVVARLADGKGRSTTGRRGGCMYLMLDGNKCAIGAMLGPRQIKRVGGFLGSVRDLLARHPELSRRLPKDVEFLYDLQSIHDSAAYWEGNNFVFWSKMRRVAEDYRLSTAAIDALGK